MAHPDWLGRAPERFWWSSDGRSVHYERKREGEETRDLYRVDLSDRRTALITDAERNATEAPGDAWDRERRRRVFVRSGDVFVSDTGDNGAGEGRLVQLTRTADAETSPFFTASGEVAYLRGGVWFVQGSPGSGSGLVRQPFDVRAEDEPREARSKRDLDAGYLERQQPRLLEIVRERRERDERREEVARERRAADPTRTPLPAYLGGKVEVIGTALSPALDSLIVRARPKERNEGSRDRMPNYVTASGMVEVEDVRVKVGAAEDPGETLILLRADSTEPVTLDLSVLPGIAVDPLADLREAARERKRQREAEAREARADDTSDDADDDAAVEEAGADAQDPDDQATDDRDAEQDDESTDEPAPRPVRFGQVTFSRDGSNAVVQAYSTDNKDRWIAAVDSAAGELRPLHRMSDPAWINYAFQDLGWLADDRTIWFLSEETGYSQLFLMDTVTGSRVRVTHGDFVVQAPAASPDGDFLYFEANRNHPGIFEVFRVPLAGGLAEGRSVEAAVAGAVEQVTDLGGLNSFLLSPEGGNLLVLHSTAGRPPELWLQGARPGAEATPLTKTTSAEFLAIDWVEPRFVEVPSSHVDRPVHARLYLPPSAAPEPRPAVVFVHGAGYLQNAHQGWSSYFREFMFHTLLARRGYVVLDMDYRASAGYGRDWRTAIYRQMGTPEVEDMADGIDYLVAEHGVDRERVGVYGGSYGGFVTFMAMFRRPELFAAGAALRPVTDWAHYNHRYTSNILNTPELDPEAYERSSPIEFAEGLGKPLLICTGMLDDNVFFQDSVRLVQRLIELGKEDWELAVYPAEAHGFVEPSSWLDEYRRILKLFETHLVP